MLNLRLARGLNFSDFYERTGQEACVTFADRFRRLASVGLIRLDADAICLDGTGIAVADAVAAEFLSTLRE